MIISTIIIGIVAIIPCSAVNEINREISHETFIRFRRYNELQDLIYDDNLSDIDNPKDLKTILIEMSSIEKSGKIPDKAESHQANQYENLIHEAYEKNILSKADATMTDLLLQTYDYESNSCTMGYFQFLKKLNGLFEPFSIGSNLRQNLEMQYETCWRRFMVVLLSCYMTLGSKTRKLVDELASSVDENLNLVLDDDNSLISSERRYENLRIADKISQFLLNSHESKDICRVFEQIVISPCKLFIDATSHVMVKIFGIFNLNDDAKEFIPNKYATILNSYNLCYRLMIDSSFIKLNVLQNLNKYRESNLLQSPIGTWQSSAINSDTSPTDFPKLITQHSPAISEEDLNVPTNCLADQSDQLQPVDDMTIHTKIEPLKQLSKISECCGRGKKKLYTILWSDGTKSFENCDYLSKFWPTEWDHYKREQEAHRQLKYFIKNYGHPAKRIPNNSLGGVGSRSDLNQNLSNYSDPNLMVVRILNGIGRGRNVKYPTEWSDGTVSMECKEYLQSRWPNQWLYHQRMRAALDRLKFFGKGFIDEELVRLGRSIQLDLNQDADLISGNLSVIKIERPNKMAGENRYPTVWSDGSKTLEDKQVLMENWREAWDELVERLKVNNRRHYLAKRKKSRG